MPHAAKNAPQDPVITGKSVRVNVTSSINAATIRHEKRHGRDYIIVPSATMPDNVVMNGIKYPAAEIEKSFHTLDRTFAPLGHPMSGENFISAREPEAINAYHVGAHNENVRRENGRVFLDKVIDVQFASQTERGRALIDAINKGDPIETSTGIYLEIDESSEPGYSYVAKNMHFDHDAILIGEEGAARPSQGVGMMVNKAGQEPQQVTVINSYIDCYEDSVEWAAQNLFESVERLDKAKRSQGFVEKIMSMLKSIGLTPEASGLNTNHDNEETPMDVTKQVEALAEQVANLQANAGTFKTDLAETLQALIKPIADQVDQLTANAKAAAEADREALTAKVVANGALNADDCKEMTVNALRKLAEKSAPGVAAPVAPGSFAINASEVDSYVGDYNPNTAIEAAKGGK